MIEYSVNTDQTQDRWLMYFASDGSWGHADDIVIVDVQEIDGHYTEVIDHLNEWQLPDFMRWYVDNQSHDQIEGEYFPCLVCELWDSGLPLNQLTIKAKADLEE